MEERFDLPGISSGIINKQVSFAASAAAQQETHHLTKTLIHDSNICLREQLKQTLKMKWG